MKGKIGFISLGCPKNTVDSEVMLGHLKENGWEITNDPLMAHIIVVNTCGFILPAREEAIAAILEAAELKKKGRLQRLIVTGCMVNRYSDELLKEIPEIDVIVDTFSLSDILSAAEPGTDQIPSKSPYRISITPDHYAYLKIGDGCSHRCRFCTIPLIKGPKISTGLKPILLEAERLAENGARELILISQDSTGWGRDRKNKSTLAKLLRRLDREALFPWIRVMYLYPTGIDSDLISAFAELDSVLPYFDLPFQHSHSAILRMMGRPGDGNSYLQIIDNIRSKIPNAVFRSSFIVGFPGETDNTIESLEQFLKDAKLLNVGIFTYWHEKGTSAFNKYSDDIPISQKEEWRKHLMKTQSKVSAGILSPLKGKTIEVILDGIHPETDLLLAGRFRGQAPEIDGNVMITDGRGNRGEILKVKIEETYDYDLAGKIV